MGMIKKVFGGIMGAVQKVGTFVKDHLFYFLFA